MIVSIKGIRVAAYQNIGILAHVAVGVCLDDAFDGRAGV